MSRKPEAPCSACAGRGWISWLFFNIVLEDMCQLCNGSGVDLYTKRK